MSFDFFNTSHLAFGSKITKAFAQLERLMNDAQENLDILYYNLGVLQSFVDSNYRVPFPVKGDRPCNTNVMFDLLDNCTVFFKECRYDTEEKKVYFKFIIYDTARHRITFCSGDSNLTKGSVYYNMATNNAVPERDLIITTRADKPKIGTFLFDFVVDKSKDKLVIGNLDRKFEKQIGAPIDWSTVDFVKDIALGTYTADKDQVIMVVGNNGLRVVVNGKLEDRAAILNFKNYAIKYLKKGDVVTGQGQVYKVVYNY